RDACAAGGLVDRELQMQARAGERRLVAGDDRLERACLLHPKLSFRRSGRVPFSRSSANVDVPWRGQVVAVDEPRLEPAGALVRNERPGAAGEEDGVEANAAAVGGRDDLAAVAAPGLDHAVDRARVELGSVGEDDERGFGT